MQLLWSLSYKYCGRARGANETETNISEFRGICSESGFEIARRQLLLPHNPLTSR